MAELIKKATRESCGLALAEYAKDYPRLVVLDADLAKATQTAIFQKACPERFVDCGIAECNMIGVAAGLASCGKIAVAASFAMFTAGRAFEQVRNSVAYPHLNVKIIGTHAGISVGEDGATHQCLEDISLMRSLPGMVVLNPCDHYETRAAVKAMLDYDGPVYLRLGRLAAECLNAGDDYEFQLGKGVTLRQGNDITLVATGLEVNEALKAADTLMQEGIQARVINIHTLKPLDKALIISAAKETGCIVTCEEHSVIGGLGDAVGDVLLGHCPVPLEKVGTQDVFGHSGPGAALMDEFGLCAKDIVKAARKALARK